MNKKQGLKKLNDFKVKYFKVDGFKIHNETTLQITLISTPVIWKIF